MRTSSPFRPLAEPDFPSAPSKVWSSTPMAPKMKRPLCPDGTIVSGFCVPDTAAEWDPFGEALHQRLVLLHDFD